MSSAPEAPPAAPVPSPGRIASFAEFWPYYISEHRVAKSRWLHFVGTSGFLLVMLASILTDPHRMFFALALSAGAVMAGFQMESERSSAPVLIGTILLFAFVKPVVLLSVVWAYAFAWVGHFRVEGNRPATFVYPLWSLTADFKMYGWMWSGRLWSGDGREVAPVGTP